MVGKVVKKECYICSSQELPNNLHIHHIDWNHNNNTPDNVVVLCQRCHVIIHRTHYVSRDEMLELKKKILSYKNDPFAPKWNSIKLVYCLHCGDIYPESKAKYDSKADMWWCKNYPDCNGAGIGFDLIPEDKIGAVVSKLGFSMSKSRPYP